MAGLIEWFEMLPRIAEQLGAELALIPAGEERDARRRERLAGMGRQILNNATSLDLGERIFETFIDAVDLNIAAVENDQALAIAAAATPRFTVVDGGKVDGSPASCAAGGNPPQ
jgi:hypothetical protein